MWSKVLDRLSEYSNPVPRYTPPRCLLERQSMGGCDACFVACPHAAVQRGPLGASVSIDPDLCTGCGLCVQACPSGALEYDLGGPLQSLHDAREDGAATLTCSQSGAGGPALPCLGRVTPAVMAAAGAWNLPLTLIHGDCAGCALGSFLVPQRLERVIDAAQALRAATGRPAQVTLRAAAQGDQARAQQVTRRGAFGRVFRAGRQELAGLLPERPLPFVDWSVPAERTPQEWRWRKRALTPAPPPEAPVYWPAPVVDDKCMDCPVCTNVCPTEAITRLHTEEGDMHLILDLNACTGCMACTESCPPRAMHPQAEWLPAAFDAPVLLKVKPR
ncbi:4Fe-4S binding protein [Deinococcus lacus]|uniref:4Fe-4S binding protein n=1 Tax=Deinococcus lacus TaxID=392561 RepID=A0ABW1YGX2_9DEIO